MVKPASFNSKYWQDIREDYEEFKAAHRIESRNRWQFVSGRLITLPGLALYELERHRYIENDGSHGYRPLK